MNRRQAIVMIERDERGRLVFRDGNGTERRPDSDDELRAVIDDILADESIPQMHRVPGWQSNIEQMVKDLATGLAPSPTRPLVGEIFEQLLGIISVAVAPPAQTARERPHLHVVQDDPPKAKPKAKPKSKQYTNPPPESGRGHRRTAIRRKADVGNPRKFRKSQGS